MELRGNGGRLTQAGRMVVELGAWTATRGDDQRLTVTARIRVADQFWLGAAGAKRLTLPIGARPTTWAAVVLEYDDRTLTLQTEGGPHA